MTESPVKKTRNISKQTSLFLYTLAGGRCEFDGCNKYLLEHYPTETMGNFAEKAHIYAFSKDGPRGYKERPQDINGLDNLILLCPECHHLIDKVNPDNYPVDVLRKFKKDHEDRIHILTGLSKSRDTIPLVMKGLIYNRHVDISNEEMQTAVAPNYLKIRDKLEINLNSIPDNPNESFWQVAMSIIDRKLNQLYATETSTQKPIRISVFAIAPIPLLVYLGSKLSDKVDVNLFQRHRNPETWNWKEELSEAKYVMQKLTGKDDPNSVVLLVNLSGKNGLETITDSLKDECPVYELTLKGQTPSPFFLNTKRDLENFTVTYLKTLSEIHQNYPNLESIHILPAVPAPIAITIGRSRLPKVCPKLLIHDYDKRTDGFTYAITIL